MAATRPMDESGTDAKREVFTRPALLFYPLQDVSHDYTSSFEAFTEESTKPLLDRTTSRPETPDFQKMSTHMIEKYLDEVCSLTCILANGK